MMLYILFDAHTPAKPATTATLATPATLATMATNHAWQPVCVTALRGDSVAKKMAVEALVALTPVEVEQYLARIGYKGPREPTLEALSKLQQCHMLSVPFENLSVYGKEEIFLTKDWLYDKIVRRHRGGFCYELNTIFAFLLDYFGFDYKTYGSRVFGRFTGILGPPNDHKFMIVNIEDKRWLSDVGFGDCKNYCSLTPAHHWTWRRTAK